MNLTRSTHPGAGSESHGIKTALPSSGTWVEFLAQASDFSFLPVQTLGGSDDVSSNYIPVTQLRRPD